MRNDFRNIYRLLNIVIVLYVLYRIMFTNSPFGLYRDLMPVIGLVVIIFLAIRIYIFINQKK